MINRMSRFYIVLVSGLFIISACKTGGRFLGNKDHSGDDKNQDTTEQQKLRAQIHECEVNQKKAWDKKTNKCMAPEEHCLQKKDGSIWMNGKCLTREHQCILEDGHWQDNACKTPEQMCTELAGHVWRAGKCLTSKEGCLSQENGYRYKWIGVDERQGECKLKEFIDFCQEGNAAPRAIQYTIAILKRKADNTQSCQAADKWISETVAKTKRLEIYDQEDRIKIEELSPLVGYTEIEELILTNNKISDLTPLAPLKNLKVLDVQNNEVRRLDGIASLLQLESLYLGHNKVSSLTPLSMLSSLKKLHLFDNRLSDIGPLEALENLEILFLKTNAIQDISPLRNLKKLQQLDLRSNPIMTSQIVKNANNCPYGPEVATKVSELCRGLIAAQDKTD